MAINTIEEAFQALGDRLKQDDVPAKARQALKSGGRYEVRVIVRQAKQGDVISMEAHTIGPGESLGTFIRLK
ncbi:hypothetical protein [Salinicola sp. CPA57]|uniref:hypothetical protein n=1 Tax=Salinicola sp. CPA57 TaxID=1949080 RepID=UPI000DA1A97F|nr:hypothetical protein [Salinicola sp. CPA57]